MASWERIALRAEAENKRWSLLNNELLETLQDVTKTLESFDGELDSMGNTYDIGEDEAYQKAIAVLTKVQGIYHEKTNRA